MKLMRRAPHKALGEKAREYYRYDLARARAGNPATQPAKKPTKKAAKTPKPVAKTPRPVAKTPKPVAKMPRPAKSRPKRAATPKQKSAERRTRRAKRQKTLKRKLTDAALGRLRDRYPKGFSKAQPAVLVRQIKPIWAEVCKAEGVSPEDYAPPKWDMVARAIDHRRD